MRTYRFRWALAALSLMAFAALLGSCGSGGGVQLEPTSAVDEGGLQSFPGLLPALDDLPEATHSVSVLGPGWYPLDVTEQGVLRQRSVDGSVMIEPDGVHITADSSPAWALFAVHGFDHDASPTSIRVETDAPADSYFVGDSHYHSGRWQFQGPFGGNAEMEYVDAGPEYDPGNHVNAKGTHYIAIVANPGTEMVLSGIELGVDGGDNAPLPSFGLDSTGGDAGITLTWLAPAGHATPDYAGAFVERAIWPELSYQEVGGPLFEQYFLDTDVTIGTKYRYRIRFEDVSGNSSHSYSILAVHAGGDTPPIAILDIPRGPLFGRQTVTFDMSSSFDPDGDAISQYDIEFGYPGFNPGIQPITGAASSVDIELQPGTYFVRVVVTANGLQGSTLRKLKVFPAWQSTPLLVSPGQKGDWRMQRNRTIHFPQTDEMLTFHDAPLHPGLGLDIRTAEGGSTSRYLPYRYNNVEWISEPVIWEDRACVAVRDNGSFYLSFYDGEQFSWSGTDSFGASGGYEQCDLVVDGDGRLRLCYIREIAAGDWRVDAHDVVSGDTIALSPVSNSSGWFDVEWNPVHGTYDVIYPMLGSSMFQRLDPVGGPVDNEMVIAIAPSFVDLEVDPATGQASVLERIGTLQLYIPYNDGTSMFDAPETIDLAADNTEFADMLFIASDATVFFGLDGLASNLYRRNGGSWDPVPASWAGTSGLHCSLGAWPDGTLQVVDGDTNGGIHFAGISAADGVTELDFRQGGIYQGRHLNAVAGNDGIHAYWIVGDSGAHRLADANGTNWVPAADNGQSFAADLMADRDGEVFLSTSWGADHELHSWNGAAWVLEGSSDTWHASTPWFVAQDNAFGGQWWAHDHSVAPARLRRMHDDDGMALLPDSIILDNPNVFEGTALATIGGYQSLVLTGSGTTHGSSVGFLDSDTGAYSELIKGLNIPSELDWTDGRRLDACVFVADPGIPTEVYYASFQFFGAGVTRATATSILGDVSVLGVETFESFLTAENASEILTTVSAAQAWSNTAVAVMDQFSGDWHRMEWSNFGNFEEIPSPDIDWSMTSMHELVVGEDGQWHLLYRDMRDGYIYCISTS